MVRRFVPRLEVFDDRCLPSVTVSEGSGFVNIISDDQADKIIITDNGTSAAGAVTVNVNGKDVWTSAESIGVIQVIGGGGNDDVAYSLTGDLAVSRVVTAVLGAGNDKFTADFSNRTIASDAKFTVNAFGEAGKDTFNIYALNVTVNTTDPSYTPEVFLIGGRGKDTFNVQQDVTGLFSLTTRQRR
jgi:hypothetical protein